MARIVRLNPRFLRRLEALGVQRGSDASAAVGATVAALSEAERLPGVLDVVALVPPTGRAFVRRVAGRNLWLWYRTTNGEVALITVTGKPPTLVADP